MRQSELEEGLRQLERHAEVEYQESLDEILANPDPELAMLRVSRLVGVVMKEPLAKPHELETPSPVTGARQAWWLDPDKFNDAQASNAWQVRLLEALQPEVAQVDSYVARLSTYEFAGYVQSERGYFGMLALGIRKYLCNDPKARAAVEEAFQRIAKTGDHMKAPTPEAIILAAGTGLGTYLTSTVPALGIAGPPVIAGVILVIYARGVGAFCRWTHTLDAGINPTSESY